MWHHVSTKPIPDGGRGPQRADRDGRLTRDEHSNVHARLLNLVPGRSGQAYKTWLTDRGQAFRAGVQIALNPFHGSKNAIDGNSLGWASGYHLHLPAPATPHQLDGRRRSSKDRHTPCHHNRCSRPSIDRDPVMLAVQAVRG